MADKGTIALLKSRIDSVLNNSKSEGSITPQEHNNLLKDVIDTLFTTYGSTTGIDSYTVLMSITQVGLQEGKLHLLSFSDTNTGDSTLQVDSLPTKVLLKTDGSQLLPGSILVGKIYQVRYNTTSDAYRIEL